MVVSSAEYLLGQFEISSITCGNSLLSLAAEVAVVSVTVGSENGADG
jgi:hypothetical protein